MFYIPKSNMSIVLEKFRVQSEAALTDFANRNAKFNLSRSLISSSDIFIPAPQVLRKLQPELLSLGDGKREVLHV